MARITRALWMKDLERLTRTITVVIAAGPLIMGIARGKMETSSCWRRLCSSSWAIDQILFLSMGVCQMRQFRMAMNGEEESGILEEMNVPLALSPGKGERARMESTDRV